MNTYFGSNKKHAPQNPKTPKYEKIYNFINNIFLFFKLIKYIRNPYSVKIIDKAIHDSHAALLVFFLGKLDFIFQRKSFLSFGEKAQISIISLLLKREFSFIDK